MSDAATLSLPVTGRLAYRRQFFEAVAKELDRAYAKHGAEQWSRHEFIGILLEEVDELKEVVWKDRNGEHLFAEAVQVAAMCLRYIETGNRFRPDHRL